MLVRVFAFYLYIFTSKSWQEAAKFGAGVAGVFFILSPLFLKKKKEGGGKTANYLTQQNSAFRFFIWKVLFVDNIFAACMH